MKVKQLCIIEVQTRFREKMYSLEKHILICSSNLKSNLALCWGRQNDLIWGEWRFSFLSNLSLPLCLQLEYKFFIVGDMRSLSTLKWFILDGYGMIDWFGFVILHINSHHPTRPWVDHICKKCLNFKSTYLISLY